VKPRWYCKVCNLTMVVRDTDRSPDPALRRLRLVHQRLTHELKEIYQAGIGPKSRVEGQ